MFTVRWKKITARTNPRLNFLHYLYGFCRYHSVLVVRILWIHWHAIMWVIWPNLMWSITRRDTSTQSQQTLHGIARLVNAVKSLLNFRYWAGKLLLLGKPSRPGHASARLHMLNRRRACWWNWSFSLAVRFSECVRGKWGGSDDKANDEFKRARTQAHFTRQLHLKDSLRQLLWQRGHLIGAYLSGRPLEDHYSSSVHM